jgi:hypothetical protein
MASRVISQGSVHQHRMNYSLQLGLKMLSKRPQNRRFGRSVAHLLLITDPKKFLIAPQTVGLDISDSGSITDSANGSVQWVRNG